jgi:type VI secretion system secreted protein VgrG
MPTWDRSKAMLQLTTSPLAEGVLIPTGLRATEGLSEPFTLNFDVLSETPKIDADTLLNKPICLSLNSNGTVLRYFHAIVHEFQPVEPSQDGLSHYNITAVPKLWFLSQTVDCRVYQKKSTVDILTAMFTDAGIDSRDFRIYGDKPVREYTTQFNESDLDFATRLMEEEGYFYFFEHSASGHKLVVTDSNSGFTTIDNATLRYLENSDEVDVITALQLTSHTTHGQVKLKDHDPAAPDKQLEKEQVTTLKTGGAATRDVFTWPAHHTETADVEAQAKRRMEAAEVTSEIYQGDTNFPTLVPGGKFTLTEDPLTDATNLVLGVRTSNCIVSDPSPTNGGAAPHFMARFTAFDNAKPWRQPRSVLRPRMEGLHTAYVLGPDGGEISYDNIGRVKIIFQWDHRGEATDAMSVWAQVVQPWAGNGWGGQFMPRVGQKVAVAFMDSDLDRPVVIGGLYDAKSPPIYDNEAEKTKSGFRTRSSSNGAKADFNEFTFDDKAGNEKVFIQAQKDYLLQVKHDQTLKIDNCRIVNIKVDETLTIGGKQTETIEKDRAITIRSGDDSLTVSKGTITTIADLGDISIKASAGAIVIEAIQSIELKVGANSVKIDPAGVTVKGTMVKVEGSAMLDMKAPMTTLKGDGMLTLKGGIAMLN